MISAENNKINEENKQVNNNNNNDNESDESNSNNLQLNQQNRQQQYHHNVTTTTTSTAAAPSHLSAQFITSVNRDTGSSKAAANITEIIEEEEDEEEEEDDENEEKGDTDGYEEDDEGDDDDNENENDEKIEENKKLENEKILISNDESKTKTTTTTTLTTNNNKSNLNDETSATKESTNTQIIADNKLSPSKKLFESTTTTTNKSNIPTPHQIEIKGETTKFILETVVLDQDNNKLINNNELAKSSTSTPVATPTINQTAKTNNNNNNNNTLNESSEPSKSPTTESHHQINNYTNSNSELKDDQVEVTEIRVEEGYATRQMDEYFRQTIAAIKEELTKKLENKDQNNENNLGNQKHGHHHHHHHGHHDTDDIGEFSDDDYDTDYDSDNENEHDFDNDDDLECGRHVDCPYCSDKSHSHHHHHHHSPNCRHYHNKHLLYQHLLTNKDKKPSRAETIASWLVVVGCIINQFIIDGLCFNYANIFDLVQKEFKNNSRLISSMPIALLIGFYLLVAPISIFLTKRYGARLVAIVGSFISTISLLISSFLTEDIIAFTLFYGIFTGIGISFIYVPSLISISKWFLKKRLFANSLTIIGACLGAAIYPILSDFFIKKYTFFGALIILSGVQFNCLVGSMLLQKRRSSFSLSSSNNTNNNSKRLKKQQQQQQQQQLECDDEYDESTAQQKRSKKLSLKNKSTSAAYLIDKNETSDTINKNTNRVNDIEMTLKNGDVTTTTSTNQNNETNEINTKNNKNSTTNFDYKKIGNNNNNNNFNSNLNRKNMNRKNFKVPDYETESTTSTSTATLTNYTLKQYWRKFVQTRKTPANTKKNLFHLIAEEKRKTRTLSKTSLEDGFVITTSNNLLAPNDESHVIVSSRHAKFNTPQANHHNPPNTHASASSRAASRIFTRIANSIRSLAHGSSSSAAAATSTAAATVASSSAAPTTTSPTTNHSPLNTTAHSKSFFDTPNMSHDESNNNKPNHPNNPTSNRSPTHNDSPKNVDQTTPAPLIPLMSVFNGPFYETQQPSSSSPNTNSNQDQNNDNQIPPQLASVFMNDLHQQNAQTPINDTNLANSTSATEYCDCYNSENQNDPNNEDDDLAATHPNHHNYHSNKTTGIGGPAAFSRYLSYRNSLTNSVRGSLMECSVPEDREDDDIGSGNSGIYDDDEIENNRNNRKRFNQRNRRRIVTNPRLTGKNYLTTPMNSTTSNPNEIRNINSVKNRYANGELDMLNAAGGGGGGGGGAGAAGHLMMHSSLANARRFISTIDGASFFNVPFNLESIEHNLRNKLIKRNFNDHYRKQSRNYNIDFKNSSTLFLHYLGYITDYRLFLNPILLILNFSFFMNIVGVIVTIVYVSEFCVKQSLNKLNSIYILSLIGLMSGLGRIISTIVYKVNDSNAKSRIFAYVLTLILAGLSVLLATVLCDTVFSCAMFAIAFGTLFGFNSCLRSLLIYDIVGLEWSDDSFTSYATLSQAIGALIGIPVAGLIYDLTENHLNVYYFSGLCLISSGLVLTPGRQFRQYCAGSIKRLNKYYLQRF